jgi:UDP-N-acetylglucosamine 2-epimerase (non-hydrolysing)
MLNSRMGEAMRVLNVFGTRPEAIKMAPVVRALMEAPGVECRVCVTAQHRQMLDQVLSLFDIVPDHDLDIMRPGQDLAHITQAVLTGVAAVIADENPDRILVHGDTTTTLAAALAGYYAKVPVGHVEAGLRTGQRYAPYPEEINRRLTDAICDLHFAPTAAAADNLAREGIKGDGVSITGNTVIDALLHVVETVRGNPAMDAEMEGRFPFLKSERRMILVTGHRRENFGDGFERICRALAGLAGRDDVEIVYPVHLNPNVQEPVRRLLGGRDNVHLLEPLDYLPFVHLMDRCHIVITDSGGIQEEAPSLGKPVLVMRDVTERPEAVAAGTVKLVGTDVDAIVGATATLLDEPAEYVRMSRAHNPYGDGHAAARIVEEIRRHHER